MNVLEQKLVFQQEGMDKVQVKKDIIYKTAENIDLKLDVYYPTNYDGNSLFPTVIFAHGEAPWETLHNAKDWGQYQDWGRLVAASGRIAITFTRRSSEGFTRLHDSSSDILDLFYFVEEQHEELGVNLDHIHLWFCSAGGPASLPILLKNECKLSSIVGFYPLMDLGHIPELVQQLDEETLSSFSPLRVLNELKEENFPPMFLVRAGLDNPVFNDSIDQFILKAFSKNLPVTVINHSTGNHGFDVRDENSESTYIIKQAISFFK